jgi:ferritin-like metal-binding protein YciE
LDTSLEILGKKLIFPNKALIRELPIYTIHRMKNVSPSLTDVFKTMLAEQLAAEKKYQKLFDKLPKLIHTDEIRLAISPGETDIESHISRLTRTMQAMKYKTAPALPGLEEELQKTLKSAAGKGASLLKDLQMLEVLKPIYILKVARYDSLYRMSATLELEEYALLLEQCSKDNQNTYAYLNQISQNVIYPETRDSSQEKKSSLIS